MRHTLGLLTILLSILCSVSLAETEFLMPRSPERPTFADCEHLAQTYRQMYREGQDAVRSCTASGARTGPGYSVSFANQCRLEPGPRIYPHCVGDEQALCKIGLNWKNEVRACQQRARAAIQEPAKEAMEFINDMHDNMNKALTDYHRVKKLMNDPSGFFRDAVMKHSIKKAEEMFDPRGKLKLTSYKEADEIFDYVNKVQREGLKTTKSPVVRKIQQEMLDDVVRRMRWANGLLMQATEDMKRFTVDLPAKRFGGAARQAQSSQLNCALLADQARSRQLLDRDENAWLELNARCAE